MCWSLLGHMHPSRSRNVVKINLKGSAMGMIGQRGQPAAGGIGQRVSGFALVEEGGLRGHSQLTLIGGFYPVPGSQPQVILDAPISPYLLTVLGCPAWCPLQCIVLT